MSEATIDTSSSVETGGSVESSQSSVETSSSQSSGENLQDRMMNAEEYWFSDGINGYYGPDGQPVLKDGKYVSTKEELDALLGNQTQTAKTPQQTPVQKVPQKSGSDTLFETDGKYDPVKSNSFLSEIDKPYYSKFNQIQQPAQQQQQSNQQQLPGSQQQQTQQSKSPSQQMIEYERGLKSNLLDPLIEARDDMVEAGRWNNENPRAVKLNQLIQERLTAIDDLVLEKKNQLWEESFSSKNKEESEKKAAKELEDAVKQSLFTVSQKYNGMDSFENLMLGKMGADGKFSPGSGHDLIMAIIDLFSDGQQVTDLGKATKDGWNKIAKSPEILATIAKYVAGYHIAKNLAKNNQMVRDATIANERNKSRMGGQKPIQSTVPQSGPGGGMPEVLKGWGFSTV